MSVNRQHLHLVQNAQNENLCVMCGRNDAILYAATKNDLWVPYRIAYKKNTTRMLCKTCVKVYKPSLSLAVDTENKNILRELPLYDKSGNLLPSVRKSQIAALPHYFPLYHLAEQKVTVTLTRIDEIFDASLLTLIAETSGNYWVDYFSTKYGFIFSFTSKSSRLSQLRLPSRLGLSYRYDSNDRFRIDFDILPLQF